MSYTVFLDLVRSVAGSLAGIKTNLPKPFAESLRECIFVVVLKQHNSAILETASPLANHGSVSHLIVAYTSSGPNYDSITVLDDIQQLVLDQRWRMIVWCSFARRATMVCLPLLRARVLTQSDAETSLLLVVGDCILVFSTVNKTPATDLKGMCEASRMVPYKREIVREDGSRKPFLDRA